MALKVLEVYQTMEDPNLEAIATVFWLADDDTLMDVSTLTRTNYMDH